MTLSVTLNLSAEAEAELRAGVAAGDAERVRQVLARALAPTVEALLQRSPELDPADMEWEAVADDLVDTFAQLVSAEVPELSDYAVSRAGIYADHPSL